jgi:hypothetical protein
MKVFPKQTRRAAILFSAVILFAAATMAPAAEPMKDIEKLTPPRTAVCFFDGERMSDLVLNARGKLTFVYVDVKLADAYERQKKSEYKGGGQSGIPQQVFAYASKARQKKKHVLFVARVQALKGWTFDPSLISVGGYSPSEGDIITGVTDNPSRELRFGERELKKGYDGFIGFFVPVENASPGAETYVGYASDRSDWKAPDKNQ